MFDKNGFNINRNDRNYDFCHNRAAVLSINEKLPEQLPDNEKQSPLIW